jgi:ABC-type multidrug transport system fused ATPase/permease subunit
MLGSVFTGLMQSVGASRKVFEYMSREPMVLNSGMAIEPVKGQIRFEAVNFAYPTRPTTEVLRVRPFKNWL